AEVPFEGCQHGVCLDIQSEREPVALAVFRQVRNPVANRVAWTAHHELLAMQQDLTRIDAIGAENCARDLRTARANQSGTAEDFAAPQLETHVAYESPAVQVAYFENDFFARVLRH